MGWTFASIMCQLELQFSMLTDKFRKFGAASPSKWLRWTQWVCPRMNRQGDSKCGQFKVFLHPENAPSLILFYKTCRKDGHERIDNHLTSTCSKKPSDIIKYYRRCRGIQTIQQNLHKIEPRIMAKSSTVPNSTALKLTMPQGMAQKPYSQTVLTW
jgi:hypothetical protein